MSSEPENPDMREFGGFSFKETFGVRVQVNICLPGFAVESEGGLVHLGGWGLKGTLVGLVLFGNVGFAVVVFEVEIGYVGC